METIEATATTTATIVLLRKKGVCIAQIRLQDGSRIVRYKERERERRSEWRGMRGGRGERGRGRGEKQQKKSGQGRQIAGPAGVYLMALKAQTPLGDSARSSN